MIALSVTIFIAGLVALALSLDRIFTSILGRHFWEIWERGKYRDPGEP